MKIIYQIIILACFSFLIACDGEKGEEPNPLFSETDLFPLSIGKTFNYWIKTYDPDGQESADRRFSQAISGDTLIAGEKWYKNEATNTFVSNKSDGLYYYYSFNAKETVIYKYPAAKGDVYNSFVYTYKPITGERFEEITGTKSVEVLSLNTSVVSPLSGTKYENCIHYMTAKFTLTNSGSLRIYPSEQYVIPGVGAVLIIDYYDESLTNKVSIREQLN
ncbi:hypothetical protein [Arcticibacterium luteifluviistationis]|nr:hypothetical protein [Arcticibacterium luteifluviistationis]